MLTQSQDVPCTGPAGATKGSLIQNPRSADVQGTARSLLLTWEAILAPPAPNAKKPLGATIPIYTFYPRPQPGFGTCQSQLHLSAGG